MCLRHWIAALCIAALAPAGLASGGVLAGEAAPRAHVTAFCLGVVWSAGQVFGMRPPLFMTRQDAALMIAMPDANARVLTLVADSYRAAGVIDGEALAAARQQGGARLQQLLADGGFEDVDYRQLRDSCRALGAALRGTDPAAIDAAYGAALPLTTVN